MGEETRGRRVHERRAHLRFSVVGQLLAAPPGKGERRTARRTPAACVDPAELLDGAAQREAPHIDEKLILEMCAAPPPEARPARQRAMNR